MAIQEETQDSYGCELADEPVVVMKFQPVKPGNSVEDKTGTTNSVGELGSCWSKANMKCEGEK